MSFRQELMKHLTALPVTEVKKLVSKYNKELDIIPVSKLKKAEILQKIKDKKPMDKQLLAKLTNEARATREGKKAQKASEKQASKKAKPDFLDLDKDGDKKESMKKAAKEAKKPAAKPKEDTELSKARKKLMDYLIQRRSVFEKIPIEGRTGEPKSFRYFEKLIKDAKTIQQLKFIERKMISKEISNTTVFGFKPRSGLYIIRLEPDPDNKKVLLRDEIKYSAGKKVTPLELKQGKQAFEKKKKNKNKDPYIKMVLMNASKLIDYDEDRPAIIKFEKENDYI